MKIHTEEDGKGDYYSMNNRGMKKLAAMGVAASMVLTVVGSAGSVFAESYGYETVNGVTEGNYEYSTEDMGSASFNVEGNHVDMTNFSFDADESLLVEAQINEEDLVYTQVYVQDEDFNVMQNLADGHYPEVITQDNAADVLNTVYQTVFGASDAPITTEALDFDNGVMYIRLTLTDGEMFLFAKEGTDQYAVVAVTTDQYGSQDIVYAAFNALAGAQSSDTADNLDDASAVEAADEVAPDEE